MLLAALFAAQALNLIAGDEGVRPAAPSFPYTSDAGVDIGCFGGIAGSKFPAQIYDRAHNERIMYNVSRCTGGYIKATNETTAKSWDIQIGPGGRLYGRDLNGDKWRYDREQHVFLNLAKRTQCAKPDYRAMCSG